MTDGFCPAAGVRCQTAVCPRQPWQPGRGGEHAHVHAPKVSACATAACTVGMDVGACSLMCRGLVVDDSVVGAQGARTSGLGDRTKTRGGTSRPHCVEFVSRVVKEHWRASHVCDGRSVWSTKGTRRAHLADSSADCLSPPRVCRMCNGRAQLPALLSAVIVIC